MEITTDRQEIARLMWDEEPERKKIAYVAGPYSAKTKLGQALNIWRAWRVSKRLWEKGYTVICPHMNSAFMDKACTQDEFIARDLNIIEFCDTVFFLPKWHKSYGARIEYKHSANKNKDIIVLGSLKDLEHRA